MTQAWRRMDEDDRTGSSVRLVRSSGAGVGASAMVVSVGAGWERLADMKRAARSTYTWRSMGGASRRWDSVFAKRSRRGILVISPNTALVTFCQLTAQRWCKVKRIRSRGDEDGALKYVRV